MTTGRPSSIRPAVLFLATVLVSGCANMLYTPSNAALDDPDASGCDRQAMEDALVKSCRKLGDAVPVPSTPPFFEVTRRAAVSDPYKLEQKPGGGAQFAFELTPLGFLAPLFGYPPKTTVFTGRVELPGAPAFDFRVNASETFTKTVRLEGKGETTLSIRCRTRGCTLSSAPAK
jgi:hypothetical protein